MSKITLVTSDFKAPKKTTVRELKDEIKTLKAKLKEQHGKICDLEDDIETERQRADNAIDRLERLENGEDDDIIISRDEYDRLNGLEDRLTGIEELQREITVARERSTLGVVTALDEINELTERLEHII